MNVENKLDHWRMSSTIAMLKIEVRTGLRNSRGSVLQAARAQYGITANSKKKALEQMLALYLQTYGREYGSE